MSGGSLCSDRENKEDMRYRRSGWEDRSRQESFLLFLLNLLVMWITSSP
jgi:hypothetical protein